MLVLQRKSGQSIVVDENITITVVEINGDKVKLAIDAPKEIPVFRQELLDAAKLNQESAITSGTLHAIKSLSSAVKSSQNIKD